MPNRENRIDYCSMEFLLLRQPTCCFSEVKPVSCRAPACVGTPPPPHGTCVLVAMGVPHHWPPFVLVAEMMEAVCVGMCVCGCGRNKSSVWATLMNTVDHMTAHVQCEKSQGCHVTITKALNEELHKQRDSLTKEHTWLQPGDSRPVQGTYAS